MEITKEQLEYAIFNEKFKYHEIAEKYNIGRSTVDRYINYYGIKTPGKLKPIPTKEELIALYINQRKSIAYILKNYKIGKPTLVKLFEKYGIKLRPLGTNQNHSWTYEEVKKYFEDKGCKLLSTEYKNANTPLDFVCRCGNTSKIRLSVLQRGAFCKKCGHKRMEEKRRFSYEEAKKVFEERGAKLLATEYKNSHTPMKFICPKCGGEAFISLSNFKKGYGCSNCRVLQFSGTNNPHYNPEITDEERPKLGRYEKGYSGFRRSVFKRDKQCVICGSDKKRVLHHLDGYKNNPEKRTDLKNAVCLCEECHKKFHKKYGSSDNTREQFEEFKKVCCSRLFIYSD